MSFDYFYGLDDAEQYSFYRIPKRLITGDEFQETNTEAKLLYGLMLDRLQLSIRNQWLDSLNRVYIIYTVEDIMADLHCGNQKACKLLSELENKTGLIKRKRQGLGKPSLIYVLKFSTSCPQNDSESHFKTCENHTSEDVKTTSLDMWKSHGNNTDFNKPEYNKTNPIYAARSDHTSWASFVLPAKAVHENQYGKGLWAKIPADGHTTLTKPYLAGQSEDGKNIWKDEKTTVSNRELKSMVEFYKKDMVPKYDIPEL